MPKGNVGRSSKSSSNTRGNGNNNPGADFSGFDPTDIHGTVNQGLAEYGRGGNKNVLPPKQPAVSAAEAEAIRAAQEKARSQERITNEDTLIEQLLAPITEAFSVPQYPDTTITPETQTATDQQFNELQGRGSVEKSFDYIMENLGQFLTSPVGSTFASQIPALEELLGFTTPGGYTSPKGTMGLTDVDPTTGLPLSGPPQERGGNTRDEYIQKIATSPQLLDILSQPRFADQSTNLLEQAKTGFRSDLTNAFPGDAFGDIDDTIIDSIITERRGPSNQLIANAGARGNFNPTGGEAANQVLTGQEEDARSRIRDIGEGLFSQSQQDINAIRDTAGQSINDFTLGGSFDITPFQTQRQGLIDERLGSLETDLRTSLGSDPLFDPTAALQAGGRAQGVVSGTPSNQPLLDTIAEKERRTTTSQRRGLNTGGSGAF